MGGARAHNSIVAPLVLDCAWHHLNSFKVEVPASVFWRRRVFRTNCVFWTIALARVCLQIVLRSSGHGRR